MSLNRDYSYSPRVRSADRLGRLLHRVIVALGLLALVVLVLVTSLWALNIIEIQFTFTDWGGVFVWSWGGPIYN